jgi:hypothetical protein
MSYTNGLDKPTDYFNTVLYVGNNSTNVITGVGFQPDFVWLKDRVNANSHNVYDVVRGTTKALLPNLTNAEITRTTGLTSFDSDGFTLGSYGGHNESSGNVAWNWLADNTSGSSNTDGSITSTVSANTTSGFSIVSYTGNGTLSTVGHGLSSSPSFFVIKDRDNGTYDWFAYHKSLGATKYLRLSGTDASTTSSVLWNDTEPTSSVFTIGGSFLGGNTNGNNYIAYCFAEVKGFSKIGSYVGNGNADGTFVYTGFKPAFVLLKNYGAAGDSWQLHDNKRLGYNVDNNILFPNTSGTESTADVIDILSNGFKLRTTASGWNSSGGSYIYMCFAENPFVTSTSIPCTAR